VSGNECHYGGFVVVKSAAVQFLRAKLDDTGISQTELAKLAGLERSHISEMLAGRLEPQLEPDNRALAVFNAEIETSYQFKPPSLDISLTPR
jgi:transcriptional regulator with XRE-family HTH domain